MKTPKFLTKLSAVLAARPKKKLQATARAVPRASMDSYEAEEPTTKLSSAFVVVLILHCVAVGGIYAFNSIKASRRSHAPAPAAVVEKAKPAAATAVKAPGPSAAAAGVAASRPVAGTTAPAPVPAVTDPKALKQYPVKAGDNATKIAVAFGLKTDELLAANNLKDGAILRQGQVLTIPTPKPAAKPTVAEARKVDAPSKQTDVKPTRTTPGRHIVKRGDTVTSIARSYGLTADELLKLNKISDAKKLLPGQSLTLPKKKG